MRYKKHMLLLALAIFLFGIAGVWASDTNDTVTGNMDDSAVGLSDDDIMGIDENEDVLNANEKTFGDLSKREIKEMIRNGRSSGFDWFGER